MTSEQTLRHVHRNSDQDDEKGGMRPVSPLGRKVVLKGRVGGVMPEYRPGSMAVIVLNQRQGPGPGRQQTNKPPR
jgi:hypothetical protein